MDCQKFITSIHEESQKYFLNDTTRYGTKGPIETGKTLCSAWLDPQAVEAVQNVEKGWSDREEEDPVPALSRP